MPKFGGLLLFRPIVLVTECSCSLKTRKVYQLTFAQLKVFLEKNRIRYEERFHRKIYSPLTFNKIVAFLSGKLQKPLENTFETKLRIRRRKSNFVVINCQPLHLVRRPGHHFVFSLLGSYCFIEFLYRQSAKDVKSSRLLLNQEMLDSQDIQR